MYFDDFDVEFREDMLANLEVGAGVDKGSCCFEIARVAGIEGDDFKGFHHFLHQPSLRLHD